MLSFKNVSNINLIDIALSGIYMVSMTTAIA